MNRTSSPIESPTSRRASNLSQTSGRMGERRRTIRIEMNFLGVGPAELLVILVVALIFVGPERLPRLAADIARTIRELRKYTSSIAAEFTEVIEDIERETAEDRSQWKEVGEGLTKATKSVATAIHDARSEAEGKPAATGAPSANGAAPVSESVETKGVAPAESPAEAAPHVGATAEAAAREPADPQEEAR
jgi:sec-independent protein translocase protein TatB